MADRSGYLFDRGDRTIDSGAVVAGIKDAYGLDVEAVSPYDGAEDGSWSSILVSVAEADEAAFEAVLGDVKSFIAGMASYEPERPRRERANLTIRRRFDADGNEIE